MKKGILSLLIMIITVIGIAGFSYAFFGTRNTNKVVGNVDVVSKVLGVRFDDGPQVIINELFPNQTFVKTFSVSNNSSDAYYYNIYFTEVVNDLEFTDDLIYTISRDDGETFATNQSFPTQDSLLLTNILIEPNEVHNYTLSVTYLDTDYDQSDDMGKQVSAVLQIGDGLKSYNIVGICYDNNGNLLTGGYAEIHSDVIRSNINSDGSFSLNDVLEGEHTIYFYDNSDNLLGSKEFTLVRSDNIQNSVVETTVLGSKSIGTIKLMFELQSTDVDIDIMPEEYTLNLTVSNGTASKNSLKMYKGRDSSVINISPNSGYHLSNVTCTNNQIPVFNDGVFYIDNPTSNTTCNVSYEIDTFRVNFALNNSSYGTLSNSGDTVNHASSLVTTLTPTTGYHYESVSCTNGQTATYSNGIITATNITDDTTCTINLAINNYTVTFVSNDTSMGTILDSSKSANYNTSVSTTIVPAAGHHYSGLSCTGGSVSGSTLIVSNVKNNITCTVNFAVNTYNVTFNVTNGTKPADGSVSYGGTKKFTSSPDTGFKYSSTSCDNGATITRSSTSYTVSGVPDSVANGSTITCSISYVAKTYNVTFNVTNGTVPANGTVSFGGTKKFTSSPDTGYKYSSTSCDNGATITRSSTSYTVSGVPGTLANGSTITCTIEYVPKTYNVTFNVTNGTKPEDGTVSFGGTKKFTSSATSGYKYSSSSCDNGATITRSSTSYTVSEVPGTLANGSTITCTIIYTDQTAPNAPTLVQAYKASLTSVDGQITLRASGASDTVGIDHYEFLVDGQWLTGGANGKKQDIMLTFSTSNKTKTYNVTEVVAVDKAGNRSASYTGRTFKLTAKRVYIWQLYNFMRADSNTTIVTQPTESDITTWENYSTKMAAIASDLMASSEGQNICNNIGAGQYTIRLFGGILGRVITEPSTLHVNLINSSGLPAAAKNVANSDEAQAIYSTWKLGTGTV